MYHGERFNSISVLVGSVFAIVGVTVMLTLAVQSGDVWKIVASAVYGAGLIMNYVVSTLYHSIPGPSKKFFQKLDHISIYILIAASYTPFCLILWRESFGWWLFGLIWLLAIMGITFEFTLAKRSRIPSYVTYLGMGLLILGVIEHLFKSLTFSSQVCLFLGGFFYVAGLYFYGNDEKYAHFHGIWHLFVFAGSGLMYFCFFQMI